MNWWGFPRLVEILYQGENFLKIHKTYNKPSWDGSI